jgi:maltokinase
MADADLPAGVVDLVPAYLGRQRWYAGSTEPAPADVRVAGADVLWQGGDGGSRLLWALVEAEGGTYQLVIGERHDGQRADFLNAHEGAVLGSAGDHCYYYDGTLDPELARHLLSVVSGGAERAQRVRPVSAEQSNTSLVYDDRLILKVFRRLQPGPNPDAEVTTALVEAGFEHAARPMVRWQRDGWDLAFGQEFLAGGTEGWALALTSLRDFYAAQDADPAQCGGDFGGEAARLGRVTAELHLAMARAFGVDRRLLADRWWPELVTSIDERLAPAVAGMGGGGAESSRRFVDRLRSVTSPGPAIRVHGDYHLGQVMRTDAGWYVLDFEGEPARPVEERLRPSSPLKDVAGMLRSLDYASRVTLGERGGDEPEALMDRAVSWERHNREAFLRGYRANKQTGELLPSDQETWATVLAAYEMDKALYELDYERAYRPDWVGIPGGAIGRLLSADL